jgi:hypothetical protein
MLSERLSGQFEFVKKYSLMPGYAIFKSEFITATCSIKRVIAKAFLCLLMIGISPFCVARANTLPESNGVASAEMKASAPIETRVGDQRSVAESNKAASKQLEPLMLFLLGTMLLSIGAAIKLAGTRNHR